MIKVGITGQQGFLGEHLYRTLGLFPEEFERIEFSKAHFESASKLDTFVAQCDVIVHLAAVNRHPDEQVIYNTNVDLVQKFIASLERTGATPHVLMSSSTQEERDNPYGRSKRDGREALAAWAERCGAEVTGLLIPNVFGAFGKPFYNSFIATFCHQLTRGESPSIAQDNTVHLIYVQELVDEILALIRKRQHRPLYRVTPTASKKVSEVLDLLTHYRDTYFQKGEFPAIADVFERNLFNTFRSYIDYQAHFPVKFTQHSDPRGAFVEIVRSGIGGQSSYSTTVSGITRGNHFHTRKIERFAVIKGKARIQLRKVGTDEALDFYLDGSEPAYVDMPIWYTHNITNIGEDELITMFWINEPYDPADPDTYGLEV